MINCKGKFEEEKYTCELSDGRTELEKNQEETIKHLTERIAKLEIENNLMRELLTKPPVYTYGVR